MTITRRGWLRNASLLLLLLSVREVFAEVLLNPEQSNHTERIDQGDFVGILPPAARVARAASVTITATRTVGMMREQSVGSGVIVASGGYVITAHHVIRDAQTVELRSGEHRHRNPRVICINARYDLVLLKVDSSAPFAAAPLADAQSISQGQRVFVVGARAHDTALCLCAACIGQSRTVAWDGRQARLRSVETAVHTGFSGGGCYDATSGRLLGIVVAKSTRYRDSGYFVSSDQIAEMLEGRDEATQG